MPPATTLLFLKIADTNGLYQPQMDKPDRGEICVGRKTTTLAIEN